MLRSPIFYPLAPIRTPARTVFVRGEGSYLYDSCGKRYLDANSGLWNLPLGYGSPNLVRAVAEQAARLPYVNMISYSSAPAERYAQALLNAAGGEFTRVIYTCSGSESIECAIKLARKVQYLRGRPTANRILTLDMSYHGTTYAAMTASGMDRAELTEYAPLNGRIDLLKTPFFPAKEPAADEKQPYLRELDHQFAARDVAAVLIEPVLASGGIIPLPAWYLQALSEHLKSSGALLIADEVATGFGRVGELFCSIGLPAKPDILCLSKAINNGMVPMGAVLLNAGVDGCFERKNEYLNHFSTQCGNPIACAAALETLRILESSDLLSRAAGTAALLRTALTAELTPLPCVREVRAAGMMFGIDLVNAAVPLPIAALDELRLRLEQKGLIVYMFSTLGRAAGITLMPTYLTDANDADFMAGTLKRALARLF